MRSMYHILLGTYTYKVSSSGYPLSSVHALPRGRLLGNVAERLGEFAVVQHGVDLNGNGVYDEEAAGPSDLGPSLPQEATLPANCGVIEPVSG